MYIHHAAIWTPDLERLKSFYETYFQARAGERYANAAKGFTSYFLAFDSGAKLELMSRPDIPPSQGDPVAQFGGFIHLSFAAGSEENVNHLTARLQVDGYRVLEGPRRTGDGYYESCVLDPDGNRVEITV